jgi:hypothetical protein
MNIYIIFFATLNIIAFIISLYLFNEDNFYSLRARIIKKFKINNTYHLLVTDYIMGLRVKLLLVSIIGFTVLFILTKN